MIGSDQVRDSRYVQGGDTEKFPKRLGWWERRVIQTADDDVTVQIPSKYDKRPDLLAAEIYGRSTLMWVVLQFNNIVDINVEFVAGRTIRLPTPKRVMTQILTKSTVAALR